MKHRENSLNIILFLLVLLATHSTHAMNWTQINTDGFGDPNNSHMKSSGFNQNLYVVTGKPTNEGIPGTPIKVFEYNFSAWQQVNTDGFGNSNNKMASVGMVVYQNRLYVGTKNEVTGTQIWAYDGSTWSQVYDAQDPAYPNCGAMAVFNDRLYFSTGYGYGNSRNRVLSYDGTNWSDTNFDDNDDNEKIDDLAVYDGRLYLSTYREANGCQIWAYDESNWQIVSTGGFGDLDNYVGLNMLVYNNRLLVSTGNSVTGGQIWAYDGQNWAQMITPGLGDPNNIVVFASSCNAILYAGTYNLATGGELWQLDGMDWIQINTGSDYNDATHGIFAGCFLNGQLGSFTLSDYGIGVWIYTSPVADAGADQTVTEADTVSLDGTGSSTNSGDTYFWAQTSGESVALSNPTSLAPSFTAPEVSPGGDTLVFVLTVTDNGGNQINDDVNISVNQRDTITPSQDNDSGGGGGGGSGCFISTTALD
jgi:hypothetical protein